MTSSEQNSGAHGEKTIAFAHSSLSLTFLRANLDWSTLVGHQWDWERAGRSNCTSSFHYPRTSVQAVKIRETWSALLCFTEAQYLRCRPVPFKLPTSIIPGQNFCFLGFLLIAREERATCNTLWDKATIMIMNSMQLRKVFTKQMTQTWAAPTRPFHIHHEHACRPRLDRLLGAGALASGLEAKGRQSTAVFQKPVVLRVESRSSLPRHRMPESKGG